MVESIKGGREIGRGVPPHTEIFGSPTLYSAFVTRLFEVQLSSEPVDKTIQLHRVWSLPEIGETSRCVAVKARLSEFIPNRDRLQNSTLFLEDGRVEGDHRIFEWAAGVLPHFDASMADGDNLGHTREEINRNINETIRDIQVKIEAGLSNRHLPVNLA